MYWKWEMCNYKPPSDKSTREDQTRISCSPEMRNGEEPITPEILCFQAKPEGLWGIHTTTSWTHFYKQLSFTTFILSKNPFCQNSPKPPAQLSSCTTLQKQFPRHLPQSKIHPGFAGEEQGTKTKLYAHSHPAQPTTKPEQNLYFLIPKSTAIPRISLHSLWFGPISLIDNFLYPISPTQFSTLLQKP